MDRPWSHRNIAHGEYRLFLNTHTFWFKAQCLRRGLGGRFQAVAFVAETDNIGDLQRRQADGISPICNNCSAIHTSSMTSIAMNHYVHHHMGTRLSSSQRNYQGVVGHFEKKTSMPQPLSPSSTRTTSVTHSNKRVVTFVFQNTRTETKDGYFPARTPRITVMGAAASGVVMPPF